MLDDGGRTVEAITALKAAIKADPDYADAIFNLALLLQKRDAHAEAAAQWKRYLKLDTDSPWSTRAKRALKFCEIKIAEVRGSS
jgi:tetratricopeptide (TPR) repeat protein